MLLRWIILTILVVMLSACAKPPQYELETTEHLLEQAEELNAVHYAPTEYKAAREAYKDGQVLMAEHKYDAARNTLILALEHIRRAVVVTQEARASETAEIAQRKAEAEMVRQAAEEEARQAEEEARLAAIEAEQKKAAEEEARKKPVERPKTPAVKKLSEYKVGEGENLSIIAAKPAVYGDGYLWPLLYQANRDQIKDPRQIFPGQILAIRRDLTPEEIEEARQKGKESDIFPHPEN